MTAPSGTNPPPLVEQEMTGGTWVPTANAFMSWVPTDGKAQAQGPIEPQVHDDGAWYPASGNAMKWIPFLEPAPIEAPVLVIVPGDEPQNEADE